MLFSSFTKFKIELNKPEILINRLREKIPLRDIRKTSDSTVELTVFYTDTDTVLLEAEKVYAKAEIIKVKGILPFMNKYKKRFGIYAGLVVASAIISFSQHTIFEVRVKGNTYIPENEIKEAVSMFGIAEGKLKKTKNLEKIYNEILINDSRISWISVNYDGMIANIEIDETQIIPEKLDRNRNINIVAKCDGIVKRIDVLDGGREVSVGDTVVKGELLISSFADTRKGLTVMKGARGSVWALTEHIYQVFVPENNTYKSYTGKQKENKSIMILGKRIPLYIDIEKYKNFSMETEQVRFNIFKYQFPFMIKTQKQTEYKKTDTVITESDARKIAENELSKRIEAELTDAEIIKKNTSFEKDSDTYVLTAKISCIENIAEEYEFEFDENKRTAVN